jgi:hypothetical protein
MSGKVRRTEMAEKFRLSFYGAKKRCRHSFPKIAILSFLPVKAGNFPGIFILQPQAS